MAYTDLCLARTAHRARRYTEAALPETLLQAFSAEPLAAGDARFVDREDASKRLLAALETWRAGRSTMVAVTGTQGCGITSFLQQLTGAAEASPVFRYGKLTRRPRDVDDTLALLGAIVGCEPPVGSLEELLAYMNKLPPSVIVIDNGHFLACRIMGAHAGIRIFGAVMVATQQRHLWVLGCREHAWRRLVYIYRADRYFTDQIELPLFDEQQLGHCLATRLLASDTQLSSGDSDEPELQTELASRQLSTLHKLSNGKPDLAFFYFLASLTVHAETRQPTLLPVVPLDFSVLKKLINEESFTLAEVAAHGRLSIDEHCALFRSSHEQSWLLLERLYHQCLLDKDETDADPAYQLVPLYSDVIVRHLTNANYVY